MKKQLLVILLLTIIGIESVSAGKIIYVKSNGGNNNNGSSWSNATSLQNALTKAVSGDDIWVAEGEYTPGSTRDASFVLKTGVKLYGGFKATETGNDYTKREGEFEKTILSGEIGKLDVISDNVYHVVILKGDNTIDGFTITGGSADETESKINQMGNGAGIFAEISKPIVIKNNIIQNNIIDINTVVVSEVFGKGGGIYVFSDKVVTVEILNNTIKKNNLQISGVEQSYANTFGGGVYASSLGNITIRENRIIENSISTYGPGSGLGGGIYTFGAASIKENQIDGNIATVRGTYVDSSVAYGGGIYTSGLGTEKTEIINNTISKNKINASGSSPSAISANGGGIYTSKLQFISVKDNNILENVVEGDSPGGDVLLSGGGISVFEVVTAEIDNNIVDKNNINTHTDYPRNIQGGGIYISTDGIGNISNNKVRENTVSVDTSYGSHVFGGGISVSGKGIIGIINNTIEKNIIDAHGVYDDIYALGGGVYANEVEKIEINNNIIRENEAKASSYKAPSIASGGGVNISGKSVLNIKNNLIEKNKLNTYNYYQPDSVLGGGIYVSNDEKTIYLVNNTIVKNEINESASEKIGAGVCIKGKAIISNSILWDNKGGKGVIEKDPSGAIEPTIQYSLAQGRKDTNNGNVDASKIIIETVFVGYQNNNYSLKENSPLIDKGNNVNYTDAGGNVSVDKDLAEYRRLSGSIIDMGAYEYQKEPVSNINVVGIESVKVYPTLTKSKVYIETNDGILPTVSIYTVNGKYLQTTKANEIDLSIYPKGIYILQIGTKIEKVIKQ